MDQSRRLKAFATWYEEVTWWPPWLQGSCRHVPSLKCSWRLTNNWRKLWKLRSHGASVQGSRAGCSCTVQAAPQPRHCTSLTHGTEFCLTFRHRASLSDSDAQRVKQASRLLSPSSGAAGNVSRTRDPRPTCASAVDRSATRPDIFWSPLPIGDT